MRMTTRGIAAALCTAALTATGTLAAAGPAQARPQAAARTAVAPARDVCGVAPGGNTPASRGENRPVASQYLAGYGHPEIDVRHTDLDLRWDGRRLDGTATLRLAAVPTVSAVTLDLSNALTVTAVRVDGRAVPVVRGPHTVTLRTGRLAAGSLHVVAIRYAGMPRPVRVATGGDPSPLGWVRSANGSVSTFAEPVGLHTWAPANELPSDKSTYGLRMTTKAGTTAVFNGTRCRQSTTKGWTRSDWSAPEPMSAYLVTLSLGRYTGRPVTVAKGRTAMIYLRPQDEDLRRRLEKDVVWSYGVLTKMLGPYPFRSLGYVVADGSTAMETQTMISFGGRASTNRTVVLHETAHQWFGDAVTTATWRDLWLNEGFATYMEVAATPGSWGGRAELARLCAMTAKDDGQAGRVKEGHLLGMGVYVCGAGALVDLRKASGDARFWAAMRGWPSSRKYGTATRADFVAYWTKATGTNPGPVLSRWLDKAGPALERG